jgi:hypothetical protein
MYGGRIWPRGERDTAELFVVQFQRVSRLLDEPICHALTCCQSTQEDLDLRSTQVPSSSAGVFRGETADPCHAIGDRLFLDAGFAKHPDVSFRPARLRVQGRRRLPVAGRRQTGPIPVLTHSKSPKPPAMRQNATTDRFMSALFLTVCRGIGPAMFDG